MRSTRLAALLLPLPFAACAVQGERADTGGCPVGEVCSPQTPTGLTFQGLSLGDAWFDGGLHPTAAGGSQPILVRQAPRNGVGNGTPLTQPFTPLTTDDAFTATASGSIVSLAAAAPASGWLRIVDADGDLMDRIVIDAANPARLELRSPTTELAPGRSLAMVPGTTRTLVTAIVASNGTRLVDEGLQVAIAGVDAERLGWDTHAFTLATEPATLTITTGALTTTLTIAIAAAAERLELLAHDPLTRGGSTVVCLAPLAGDRQVLGLAMTWTDAVGAEVSPIDTLLDNCALVHPTSDAPVAVTVAVPGASARLSLPVGAGARRAPAAVATDWGDRARLVAE